MPSSGPPNLRTVDLEVLLRHAAPAGCAGAPAFLPRDSAGKDDRIASRLSRWRENAAENSTEAFARRLDWEGLTPETVQSVLGDARPLIPEDDWWTAAAWRIFRRLAALPDSAEASVEGDSRPIPRHIPFAPILAPLVRVAMSELSREAGDPPAAPDILGQLGEPLYERLSRIFHRALGAEFRGFRDALPARHGAWRAFEGHMRGEGLRSLFDRLPVLLRLAAIANSLWAAETVEFLRRLEADRECLGQVFSAGDPPGAVERISGLLSDPHCGGRNVKTVRFASGLQVVYKPKSLAIDAAWFALTEWVGRHTCVAIRSPRVLNRGDWGWVEFIPHEPCRNIEAVERFYHRSGHLLCLLYCTVSEDFHHENIVACGEFPVPIDLETVFRPEPLLTEAHSAATLQVLGSVSQTLMLPRWMEFSGQSDAVDISGLGSGAETQSEITNRRWIHANTDEMEFVAIREKARQGRNAPFPADGPRPDAGQFAVKVAEGFAEAYDSLKANRHALLSPDGPLEAFRNCRTRVVFRPTRTYDKVAERALSPACLACGVDRSLEFEGLSRHFLASREGHGSRAMFRAEVRAMERMDIPYFQVKNDSRDLLDDEGAIVEENFFKTPGYDRARQRIAALSAADRSFQLDLILASFAARDFGGPGQPPLFRPAAFSATRAVPDHCDLREAARRIARDIEGRAIRTGDEANWIAHDTLPVSGRLCVQALGPSLYSGLAGLSVFLAAQSVVDGCRLCRRAALAAARTVRRSLVDSTLDRKTIRTFFLAEGIGVAAGAASALYGLLKTGQLLNDEETLDTALGLSRLLDEDAIRSDKRLDVISGAAGTILSLLRLFEQTGESELLEKAALCGERLLRMQSPEGAWLTIARRPLAGFSHGAAGIGLALLRLHAAVPDARFRRAAMAGFRYEHTLFSPEAGNWEDRRDHVTDRFAMASWCHGAPGVALSRIGVLKQLAGEDVESTLISDLDVGLRCLAEGAIGNDATVCCGEMGRVEILLEAARYARRPELEELALQRASCVVAGLLAAGKRPFIPGFFKGLAGIGYGLLRLIAPDRLPSILLWE